MGTESTHWRTGRCGITASVRCAATSAMRRALQEGQTPRPLQEKARSRSCPQSPQRSRANPCGLTPARRSGGSPAGSAKPTRGPGCRSGDNRESRVPPRWGPPSPWGRRPAPRRGRFPGDAGPPGRAVFRWGAGDDRQRRQGGTSAPGSSPTIDGRHGKEMGNGEPSPKPLGIRGPGHGWISQALPSPQAGPKQKSSGSTAALRAAAECCSTECWSSPSATIRSAISTHRPASMSSGDGSYGESPKGTVSPSWRSTRTGMRSSSGRV